MTTPSDVILCQTAALPKELRAYIAGFAWTLDDAVYFESLTLIRLMHRDDNSCTILAMNAAASRGLLDIVRFLHVHRSEGCSTLAMNLAAAHGHLRVVQFLHRARHEGCTPFAMEAAAANGHLGVLQYLHRHTVAGFTTGTIDAAASKGHLSIVRFLLENRREAFSVAAIDRAMENGHDEIVDLLLKEAARCTQRPFTKLGLKWAARNNHIQFAQRLLARFETETSLDPSSVHPYPRDAIIPTQQLEQHALPRVY